MKMIQHLPSHIWTMIYHIVSTRHHLYTHSYWHTSQIIIYRRAIDFYEIGPWTYIAKLVDIPSTKVCHTVTVLYTLSGNKWFHTRVSFLVSKSTHARSLIYVAHMLLQCYYCASIQYAKRGPERIRSIGFIMILSTDSKGCVTYW